MATHSRLKPLRDFAWMVRRHEERILNYFKVPISNGIVEGLNNKAKVISHRGRVMFFVTFKHCYGNSDDVTHQESVFS